MMQTIKRVALAGAVAVATAFSAAAAPIAVTNAPHSWTGGATSTALPTGASWVSAPKIVSGSIAGVYRSPYDPEGPGNSVIPGAVADWDEIDYFTVGSPAPYNAAEKNGTQYALLDLGSMWTSFSMLWGSVDTYNVLAFYAPGVKSPVASFTGSDIIAEGATPSGFAGTFVSFTGLSAFRYVYFGSNRAAFEFSNIAAVPLPAGGILLLTALGGLVVARRRKA